MRYPVIQQQMYLFYIYLSEKIRVYLFIDVSSASLTYSRDELREPYTAICI